MIYINLALANHNSFGHFIVATMIFGISGILSLQQGFSSLLGYAHHFENPLINYVVLSVSHLPLKEMR